jgi:hypothetical protein
MFFIFILENLEYILCKKVHLGNLVDMIEFVSFIDEKGAIIKK